MRYVLGTVMLVTLVLGGCSGGSREIGSSGGQPAASGLDPNDRIESFDYLGPLWKPQTDGVLVLPNLAPCLGGTSEYPLASCIAAVTLDGAPADAADLDEGQIVEIHGARVGGAYLLPLGRAIEPLREHPTVTVDIRRAIVGPVEAIDVDRAWLTVLGQRVYAYDAAVASARVGDNVTVYGHFTASGQVVATLVEPYEGDAFFLLRGVLSEPTGGHFAIGGLEVDLSSAHRENFPGGAPLPGDAVLVLADQPPDQAVLTAATVRCIGACASARWETGLVRGFLTGWRSPTDFDIDGVALRLKWCECGYAPPLALGSFVDIHVSGGNAEVTRASSTSFRLGLAGRISSIDAALGEIVVLGYRVDVSPATQISTSQPAYFELLPINDLRVGDSVEISGAALGSGIRAGSIVRQEDANDAYILSALDYTLAEPTIEIAGRTLLTDGATQVSLCQNGGSMSVGEFFATAWSELGARLAIVIDPSSEPLLARAVTVCTPDYR